jgi:hypothetical protein
MTVKPASNTQASDPMTAFERGVVFRVARGFFVFLALAAVLGFGIAGIVWMRGVSETSIDKPELPAAPAPRARINYQQLLKAMQHEAEQSAQASQTVQYEQEGKRSGSDQKDETAKIRFNQLVGELQALFPAPTYTWTNQTERKCTVPSAYGCFHYETRIVRTGVAGIVQQAVSNVDAEVRLELLEALVAVLKEVPVEKRAELIAPIVRFEQTDSANYEDAVKDHRDKIAEIEAKYERDVEESRAQHEEWKRLGMYGLGAGMFGLVLVSLFLAFLAIERHSRALERLVAHVADTPPQLQPVAMMQAHANDNDHDHDALKRGA